ncbi:MAG TPA: nucleotidyl transferase AbiEii/AbiGii toxin family protein, partial [Ktedonobacterales bacterium]|nr:nucleotidyl transferase AbiEii/AbiGii toxin family protein [Ktedonobacterales bacterium]
PTLLEFPAPRIRAYARETVIAEKVSALIVLGPDNARIKDYFDLWFLSRKFQYTGMVLRDALAATLVRRGVGVPDGIPPGLSDPFANDRGKQTQWSAFVRQSVSTDISSTTLSGITTQLRSFLLPILSAIRQGAGFEYSWAPGGPWSQL